MASTRHRQDPGRICGAGSATGAPGADHRCVGDRLCSGDRLAHENRPTGFLPDEDQGAFFAEVQLPDAASLNRTNKVVAQVEDLIQDRPWTQSVLSIAGYSLIDGLALPNKGLVIIGLKPFDERTDASLSVFSALAELRPLFRQIAAANVIAFNPPPISGLGNAAGFELQLQSLAGANPKGSRSRRRGTGHCGEPKPGTRRGLHDLRGVDPAGLFKLDRERAETLGVSIGSIFSALQTAMGGTYVNDFNRFGRTWQVKVQADASDRKGVQDIFKVRVRTAQGDLVPLNAVADVELITAPSSIIRYNNLRSVTINGGPAPGYSSGQAIAAMQAVATDTCPAGFPMNGPALRSRKRRRRGKPARSSVWRSSSPICFSSASTRAGRYRSRLCCPSSSACLGQWRL